MTGRGDDIQKGTAGASARREHERRRANRERRVHDAHPLIGGLIIALGDEPRHQRVWAGGAVGEEYVQRTLDERCPEVPVLHDRRITSRSRANIDHIAIAPSGVWVIDTKRYVEKKIEVVKPWFEDPYLRVGGRNQTKLIDGLAKQVELVRKDLAGLTLESPLHGCLCFVDGQWGWFADPLSFRGFTITWPRDLAKRLDAAGPLTPESIDLIARHLAKRFPPA